MAYILTTNTRVRKLSDEEILARARADRFMGNWTVERQGGSCVALAHGWHVHKDYETETSAKRGKQLLDRKISKETK